MLAEKILGVAFVPNVDGVLPAPKTLVDVPNGEAVFAVGAGDPKAGADVADENPLGLLSVAAPNAGNLFSGSPNDGFFGSGAPNSRGLLGSTAGVAGLAVAPMLPNSDDVA